MTSWLEIGLSNALLAAGMAVVAWLITRIYRHPKVVFAMWLLVLAKLVVPPVWGIPWQGWRVATVVDLTPEELFHESPPLGPVLPVQTPPVTPEVDHPPEAPRSTIAPARKPETPAAAPPEVQSSAQPAASSIAIRWQWPSLRTIVITVWLCGSVLWLLLAAVRIGRFHRTLARAQLAGPELESEVADVARRMGLRRVPRVRLINASVPPLVWAMTGRARVVLPAALLARLSDDQRITLLAHELAHLKRRDHLVRLLEMAALAVYWWNPIAWWARRHMERAGEACCDGAVVARFPTLNRAYAEALLATVDFFADARPVLPAGSSGLSQVPLLRRRLEMILSGTRLRRINWPLRLSLAVLAAVVLPPFIHSVAAAPKTFVPKSGTIEQRLDRLEKAMQELTREIRAMHKAELANASPRVIQSVPENGDQNVDPNLTEIKVTFNKDMHDGSWSWTQRGSIPFPEVTGKIHYLKDKRTCVLPVKLEPNTTYYMSINSERFKNFKDTSRQPAVPYPIRFKTK